MPAMALPRISALPETPSQTLPPPPAPLSNLDLTSATSKYGSDFGVLTTSSTAVCADPIPSLEYKPSSSSSPVACSSCQQCTENLSSLNVHQVNEWHPQKESHAKNTEFSPETQAFRNQVFGTSKVFSMESVI